MNAYQRGREDYRNGKSLLDNPFFLGSTMKNWFRYVWTGEGMEAQ